MLTLTLPDPARHGAWKAAFDEFGATAKDGTGFSRGERVDTTPAGFDAYLADRARQRDVTIPPREGFVHSTYFWVMDDTRAGDDELVGFVAVRHALTERLFAAGGHIGYSVRPSARGRGVATGALTAGLAEAAKLGIDQVLVCCSTENAASRAVIEKCGGDFDGIGEHPDLPGQSRRYWFGAPPWPSGPTAG